MASGGPGWKKFSTMHELLQSLSAPETPKAIVIFGAGSIVRDAHLPAYRRAGFPVSGIFDPDIG